MLAWKLVECIWPGSFGLLRLQSFRFYCVWQNLINLWPSWFIYRRHHRGWNVRRQSGIFIASYVSVSETDILITVLHPQRNKRWCHYLIMNVMNVISLCACVRVFGQFQNTAEMKSEILKIIHIWLHVYDDIYFHPKWSEWIPPSNQWHFELFNFIYLLHTQCDIYIRCVFGITKLLQHSIVTKFKPSCKWSEVSPILQCSILLTQFTITTKMAE